MSLSQDWNEVGFVEEISCNFVIWCFIEYCGYSWLEYIKLLKSISIFSMSLENNRIDDASNYVTIIENDYPIYKLYLLIYYTQIILTFLLSFFLKCSIQCYYS